MTAQLSNAYTNLSAANQLAVSASSTFAVLTLPALNAIAVFEPNTSEAGNIIGIEETGLIQSDGVTYKTPVISPDDRFYAVVASRDTESGTERSIEIRHNLSRDVVGKVTPDGIDQEYLNLSAWSDIKVNPLPLQPENLSETIELD